MNGMTVLKGVCFFGCTYLALRQLIQHFRPKLRRKLRKLYKKLYAKKREAYLEEMEGIVWNTALFFPDYFPENEDTTTRRLIWYLEQTETTLDLCLYSLNFRMLEETIIELSEKGVIVRILSNRNLRLSGRFRKAGIQTRSKIHCYRNPKAPNMFTDLLHHKFAIIDDYAVITGSLNWTNGSITENKENVVITNHVATVMKFKKEFERLWLESEPSGNRDLVMDENTLTPC